MPMISFWRKIPPGSLGLNDVVVRLNGAFDKLTRALFGAVPMEGAALWNPLSVAGGASVTTTVLVPGARVGMPALAGFSLAIPPDGRLVAQVQSDGVVLVALQNGGAGAFDLAEGVLRVKVWE